MTGDGAQDTDGLAAGRRTDAPTSALPCLAAGAGGVSGSVSSSPVSPENNPVRARMVLALKTLESLRNPTVEQIERKLFLKEYLGLRF